MPNVAINAETIEQSIRDKLHAALSPSGVEVVVLPENEADFKRPFLNARVTVAYHSSRAEMNEPGSSAYQMSAGLIVQRQMTDVEILVEAHARRGPFGVLDVIRLAKRLLVGFKPAGCGRLVVVDDKFGAREDGLWLHSLVMRCETRLVEAHDVIEPLAQQVTVNTTVLEGP